ISVVSDQIGTPTYAGDLAELILQIIDKKSKDFGLYHYSNEGEVSWYDFAKTIFEILKIDIKVNPINTDEYPALAKRPSYSVIDKSKAKRNFLLNNLQLEISLKKCLNGC